MTTLWTSWTRWTARHLWHLVLAGVVLDLVISAGLSYQQYEIKQQQHASGCWDHVLVVAVHDHLTTKGRTDLIAQANHCAAITK